MRRLAAAVLSLLRLAGSAETSFAQPAADDTFISAIKLMRPPQPPQPQSGARSSPSAAGAPIVDRTGFFISSRGDFLTAAHVLQAFGPGGQLANCPLTVLYEGAVDVPGVFGGVAFVVSLSDCVTDIELDIARCHTIDAVSKLAGGGYAPRPVTFDASQRDDGTAIAITGFPLLNIRPVSSRGYIGAYTLDPRGPVQMVLDRASWPGGSGSPVYDSKGKVLGMVLQTGEGLAVGISNARSSFAIAKFLAAHPIKDR
ncbi:MAG TPA: serine protease [Rhizomicrobium sp.]|jgi:hypothetical protein|nr:serine protease [Rhizomicrobium sp.]